MEEDKKILKAIKFYKDEKEKLIKQVNDKNSFSMSMIISKAERMKEYDLKLSALQLVIYN